MFINTLPYDQRAISERSNADSVVNLNYGKELDQTNVQTALRDSEAHAIEQEQRGVT